MAKFVHLLPGDPAPWFSQRGLSNPRFVFDTVAGRYLVLCFMASGGLPASARAIAAVQTRPDLFNDVHASFFGVTHDPADEAGRLEERYPGYRYFLDFDGTVGRPYGALPIDEEGDGPVSARRLWVVLDPTMRVLRTIAFAEDGSDVAELITYVEALPPPARFAGFEVQAPILILPNVLEPELCEQLIALYEEQGGTPSGFMREIDGKTMLMEDPKHKRRRDIQIADRALIDLLQSRFRRRVVPEIQKVHQFHVTRMERYIVACYLAEEAGHFRAHRDNTTGGTAHRRFAVSVNLNSEFEGGGISFPEYGPREFKPPPGGACVFSCSLLHQVSPVTAGRRYAFLPFLYDDAAARLREANNEKLGDGVAAYRAGGAG